MERHTTRTAPETHVNALTHNTGRITSLTLFFTGLSYLLFMLVVPLMDQTWHLSLKLQGLLGLAALCGMIVGVFASAYGVRILGQRSLLVISISGALLCAVCSIFTTTLSLFILARFLLGMCVSSNYPVITRYLRLKTKQCSSVERFHADPLKKSKKGFIPDVKFDPYISF